MCLKCEDEMRFDWESFAFGGDRKREEFFQAVEDGDYEKAEQICDQADVDRFETAN